MSWYLGPLATLDFETTGVDPHTDRILSFAALGTVGDLVGYANPGVPIPERSSQVHGITAADLADEPPSRVALEPVLQWIADVIAAGDGLVVYNAPYDLTMLRAEAQRLGLVQPAWERLRVVDPLVLDWVVDRYRRGKRTLTATAQHYGVLLDDAHNAQADAIAARELARAIGAKYSQIGDLSLTDLAQAQCGWFRDKTVSWNEWAATKGRRLDDPSCWPYA